MASQALNWTGILQKPLESLLTYLPGQPSPNQTLPLLERYLTTLSSNTVLGSFLATVVALLFVAARFFMHRSSFAQPYQNGGRSPYAAYAQTNHNDRSMSDLYDYVDEQHNVLLPPGYASAQVFDEDDAPDTIHIRFRGDQWPIDFPPYSIAEEKVLVKHVRDRVALRLGLDGEEDRIKLMYKDKELKWNSEALRKYGCKQNSEIMAILQQEPVNHNRKTDRGKDSESEAYVSSARPSKEEGRRRSNSTYRRRDPVDDPRSGYPSANGHLHPHDTPPMGNTPPRQPSPIRPTNQRPQRQSSPVSSAPPARPTAPAVQPPQADPSTDLGKIQQLRYEFHSQWVPLIENFLRSPPSDRDERDKEYRRLNEIAYKKVFEPGDLMQPEGADKVETKATRKKLYNEATGILKDLDKYKPREGK